MIVGFSGYKHTGKDTCASYLVEKYSFEHHAFAHKMKQAVAALWGIDVEEVDELKGDPAYEIPLAEVILEVGSNQYSFSWREHLQRFGTEMGRRIFGEDFWVKLLMDEYVQIRNHTRWVVSDMRFPNECRAVDMYGGTHIRVNRPGYESDGHESEQDLTSFADFVIVNSGTIEDLHKDLDEILQEIGIGH